MAAARRVALPLLALALPTAAVPNGQGCVSKVAKALPYCNTSLSTDARIADIISRLTIEEKALHLHGSGGSSEKTFPAVPRIGLPGFDWSLEGQHGLRVDCTEGPDGVTRCPTTFPNPTGLGASFNDSMVKSIGLAMGMEARGLSNIGDQDYGRLVLRTAVVNLIRDPRWGRNVEVPSEDPLHAGRFGTAIVSGVQTPDENGYYLAGTQIKHFAVYQAEDCGGGGIAPGVPSVPACSRFSFKANISEQELNETYLVPFKNIVTGAEGGPPTGYMCSYNEINGVPGCANKKLSNTIRSWGFKGYCGTDCSAADDVWSAHHYAPDLVHAYADTINGGSDLICNPHNITALEVAVEQKLINKNHVDTALTRSFGVLFSLGFYDPVSTQPYTNIKFEDVFGNAEHAALSLEAARQSTVLLVNNRNTLPLPASGSIAVVGPQGNATGQLSGNYVGQLCADGIDMDPQYPKGSMAGGGGQLGWMPCVPTLHDAVKKAAPGASVQYVRGCGQRCSGEGGAGPAVKQALWNPNLCNAADLAGVDAAVEAALNAEVAVLALGFDTAIAGETHDRLDTALSGAQEQLALGVLRGAAALERDGKARPKIILVLYAGAALAIDALLAEPTLDAVILGHMPGGTGGTAVAEALFGMHNDFGKLPYTMYPHAYQNQTVFTDMSFRTPPGRTHRFYTGTPLFSYGAGLSYTSFDLTASGSREVTLAEATAGLRLDLTLRNTGSRAGSQVVFAWMEPASEADRAAVGAKLGGSPPRQVLVGYTRTQGIAAGAAAAVSVAVDARDAMLASPAAERMLPAATYTLRVDCGTSGACPRVEYTVRVATDLRL